MKTQTSFTSSAGIGLRLPHLAEVAEALSHSGVGPNWLEIHPENFLANPHALELLLEVARYRPVSVHTVGISVGTATGIDRNHLKRLSELVERLQPALVSGHLAWSSFGETYLNDLLPIPYTKGSLNITADHIRQVQDAIGRSYLIENPSSYVGFRSSTMSEPEFLAELVIKTGCKLLCDVSNIWVSSQNVQFDPYAYVDQLPANAIGEFHLGGYTPEADPATPDSEVLIDTHSAPISHPAWALYGYALNRIGSRPTLIEWDNDIPSLSTLLEEARTADEIRARMEAPHALVS
jgi:uncharacterized protein (UPF0276 family)